MKLLQEPCGLERSSRMPGWPLASDSASRQYAKPWPSSLRKGSSICLLIDLSALLHSRGAGPVSCWLSSESSHWQDMSADFLACLSMTERKCMLLTKPWRSLSVTVTHEQPTRQVAGSLI